ncbi:transglycosylase SLT domain-containing protein [Sphingomonas sp. 3-13AW]|uniref:transglycosylase SLT domain-containing protein n=1 Tax=Sphingomonas sp. 3-13AW TaxID=3050450 RepID=UPI003BB4C99B
MKKAKIIAVVSAALAVAVPSHASAQVFGPSKGRAAQAQRMKSWEPATVASVIKDTQAAVRAARAAGGRVGALPSEAVSVYNQKVIAAAAPTSSAARGYGTDMTPDRCEYYIRHAERRYGLPPYLLHAISLTESGRGGRPNPFAMNVGGRSYSARDVNDMVRVADANWGVQNVDVGCMQISLKHHGNRFHDWKTLLAPQYNVEYAAYYLSQLKRELGTWTRAVGAYHSRTQWRGANYVCLVTRRWGQIFGSDRPGCGPNLEMMAQLLYQDASWTN